MMKGNQCDGCLRGLPIIRGIHRDNAGRGVMICDAGKYGCLPFMGITKTKRSWAMRFGLWLEDQSDVHHYIQRSSRDPVGKTVFYWWCPFTDSKIELFKVKGVPYETPL